MAHFPIKVDNLPPPPSGRVGFPWTEGTEPFLKKLPGGKAFPKISVVTPSYQQGQYLEETIRSVLLQGYPNLEYIVMDGGSKDNSAEIIRKYAPFLTFWSSERDSGQANAVNKGFAHSSGEIMGWLNSDDILLPGALYRIAQTLSEKPEAQFVTGFRKNIDAESRVTSNFVRDIPSNYYMRHYCCIAQETTYWRRSVWEKLGELDETFHFALDYEYWLRAIHNGYTFHLIPHYIGGFRAYAENKSSSWKDVYDHDMRVLYHRYAMGKNEAEIHAKLGQRWARRYALYLEISRQSWTNSPRLVQLAWRILETPLLCDAVLSVWKIRQLYTEFHQTHRQSRITALKSTLSQMRNYLAQPKYDSSQEIASSWGKVQLLSDLREMGDGAALAALPADTLAFGKNWYSSEFYQGEYFRWCSGVGEIIIVNASGQHTELSLVISPAVQSSEHRLDVVDETGTLLSRTQANQPRVRINLVLSSVEGAQVRYFLRWSGATGGESEYEDRRLAFRILRIGWQNATAALESSFESFQHSVDSMVTRRALDNLPVIGNLTMGIRRLWNAGEVMTGELAFWHQLAENPKLRDAGTLKTTPRFVIDCSTYMLNNNGDKAMFTVLLQRLRARYPDAQIKMITNDAGGIASLDSSVTPLVVGDRRLWSLETILGEPAGDRLRIALWKAETVLRLIAPEHYWAFVAADNPAAKRAGRKWQSAVQNADAVFLTGGGYFTDAFAEHALALLSTLEAGIAYGAATFIVGCGFEPTTNPVLNAAAGLILPGVDFISCREEIVSPQVLGEHGVDPVHFRVTGDDALELAFAARPSTLGNAIGVNLRNAVYNPVDPAQIESIRSALASASESLGSALVPLPISNWDPWDAHEIQKLIAKSDGGATLDTPQKLFEQMRGCRLIVTGSYHAAVFGLAMGISVIALTSSSHYQHKMQGLLSIYSHSGFYENNVFRLDDPELGRKLAAAISRLWGKADEVRPHLLEITAQQIRAGHEAYEKMFMRIDARRANRFALMHNNPHIKTWITHRTDKSLTGISAEQDIFKERIAAGQRIIKLLTSEATPLEIEPDERAGIVEMLQEYLARLTSGKGEQASP